MTNSIDEPQLNAKELALMEKEREINARLDAELMRNPDKFPKAVYFIIPNEFCERFCFYGIKNLLNKYLMTAYGMEEFRAKSYVHLFNGLVYMFPLAGAALSDSFLGKYHVIVLFSILYLIGNALLSLFSVNNLLGSFGNYQFVGFIVPAILIAMGTGGIKPCVSAHGGDQFLPSQTGSMDKFFALFYVSINLGAFIAQYLTPYIKNNVECFGSPCYLLAFGIPTVFFGMALIVFMMGHKFYRIVPAQGEFLPWKALKLTVLASSRYFKASKSERVNKSHWLKFAQPDYEPEFIEETRLLGKVVIMFIPIIFAWVLYDQNGTEWQNQYEKMDKNFLGFIPMSTEASGNLNTIFIITLVPLLSYVVYPFLENRGIKMPVITRIVWGFLLIILSFVVSTSLEYIVDQHSTNMIVEGGQTISCSGCINGTWQLPQWFLLSLGEAMLSPTGVQFAYTQVGRQMKASSSSIWLLTTALGNYVVLGMEPALHHIDSAPNRQWVYVGLSSLFFLIFLALSKFWFISKEDEDKLREANTNPQHTITATEEFSVTENKKSPPPQL